MAGWWGEPHSEYTEDAGCKRTSAGAAGSASAGPTSLEDTPCALRSCVDARGRQRSHLVGLYRSRAMHVHGGGGPVGMRTWCQLTSRLTDRST